MAKTTAELMQEAQQYATYWNVALYGDLPEGLNLEEVERDLLLQALDRTDWNQTHAGRLLGINRDQVRYRIEKFGLPPAAQQRAVAALKT